jgi:hypothetical protein
MYTVLGRVVELAHPDAAVGLKSKKSHWIVDSEERQKPTPALSTHSVSST